MGSSQLWHVDLEEGAVCRANAKSEGFAMSALSFAFPLSPSLSLSHPHAFSLSDTVGVEPGQEKSEGVCLGVPQLLQWASQATEPPLPSHRLLFHEAPLSRKAKR